MRFEFDNLGPIRHGEVELGKLTIFCGKNNTGKTYVNYLIYGFYHYLQAYSLAGFAFDEVYKTIDNHYEINIRMLYEMLDELENRIQSEFEKELPKIFRIGSDFFENFHLNLSRSRKKKKITFVSFRKTVMEWFKLFDDCTVNQEKENIIEMYRLEDSNDFNVLLHIRVGMAFIMNDLLYGYKGTSIFMLPAERSGLNMFYRELNVNRNRILFDLNQQMNLNDLETKVAKYPLPISDYINLLNSIDAEEDGFYNEYAATLEEKIVCGKFSVSQNGLIQFMLKDSKKLDFHLSSSTAKSLFGLDYLLKNVLRPGCSLIVDEPEQNLHPDNQRYIARLLCKLANAGVTVVVSTHSDYIIKEVNNLIILANRFKGYETLMNTYGYEEKELLPKEYVKGYIFKENIIEEVAVNEEGMQMDVFDDVINNMNEASDDIYYTYCEEKEDEQ